MSFLRIAKRTQNLCVGASVGCIIGLLFFLFEKFANRNSFFKLSGRPITTNFANQSIWSVLGGISKSSVQPSPICGIYRFSGNNII